MTAPLLAVKLFLPLSSQNQTERPQLSQKLESGRERYLTLLSAPAGFGKSSLLSMWIRQQMAACANGKTCQDVFGWLSLDAADNDPVRFWTYMIAACQSGYERSGRQNGKVRASEQDAPPFHLVSDLLRSDPPPSIELVLDRFINIVTDRAERILLVLDDYHTVQSALIHEQMTYLLDHLPPNLHLVIATRNDPPLPIARLRIRGQLSEIRAADLRFNQSEVDQFLTCATGIHFPAEDICALEESTEGWVAGLQMATLAMQGNAQNIEKARELIHAFSGKHVYILDYLADEVFNRQPAHIQAFLLKTSILERFCAGLCDAVMRESVPELAPVPASREVLTYLEKANLFLIPLDNERQWFRFHHLFADLLRVRLEQAGPEQIPGLHIRAAEWYEHSGFVEQAIHHAIAAPDWDRAAALLEGHIKAFLERGQLSRIMEWIARLPKEIATQRAWLTIQQATLMGLAHRLNEFVALTAASEKAVARMEESGAASPDEIRQMRCNTFFQRGYYALATRQPAVALQLAEKGLKILPEHCPWEAFWLYWLRAYAHRALNHLELAQRYFQDAMQALAGQELWTDMICLTDMAMVCHLRGELPKACALYEQALELGRKRRASGHSYLNRVEGWLSLVLLERNEIKAAASHARTGLEWSQYWPSTNARSVTFIALGRIQLFQGDLAGAEPWFQKAEQERQKSPLMPVNNSLLDYNLVRFWLAKGDLEAAGQWARPFQEGWRRQDRLQGLEESYEMQLLALARVLIAQGSGAALAEALELLDAIQQSARACERVNVVIEAGVLKSMALLEQSQKVNSPARPDRETPPAAALRALEESLAAGEPGGYMRVFLDEGPQMAAMLRSLRFRGGPDWQPRYSKDYLDALLTAFPAVPAGPEKRSPLPALNLPEPLTERELEVLRLLATGLSNREIAESLVVSEGTVKSHVHNIMGKLDAQSRTRAIAIAKELGIL